jgi:hypothetical protein
MMVAHAGDCALPEYMTRVTHAMARGATDVAGGYGRRARGSLEPTKAYEARIAEALVAWLTTRSDHGQQPGAAVHSRDRPPTPLERGQRIAPHRHEQPLPIEFS